MICSLVIVSHAATFLALRDETKNGCVGDHLGDYSNVYWVLFIWKPVFEITEGSWVQKLRKLASRPDIGMINRDDLERPTCSNP